MSEKSWMLYYLCVASVFFKNPCCCLWSSGCRFPVHDICSLYQKKRAGQILIPLQGEPGDVICLTGTQNTVHDHFAHPVFFKKTKKGCVENLISFNHSLYFFLQISHRGGVCRVQRTGQARRKYLIEYFRVCHKRAGGEPEAKPPGASLQTHPVRFLQSKKKEKIRGGGLRLLLTF